MKQFIYTALLILCVVTTHAQQELPNEVKVPTGSTLLTHVYAKGVQIYRCAQDIKDASKYVWIFQEPKAELFADANYSKKIGKHYLNTSKSPTWELFDGSLVSGAKLRQASPDSLAIPWLLLKAVQQSGKGSLTLVAFIQRLNTIGGIAPIGASRVQKGQVLQIPYTAEYSFYK